MAKVRLLGLAQNEEGLVLGGNLLRLIRRTHRQRSGPVFSASVRAATVPSDQLDPWAEKQFPR